MPTKPYPYFNITELKQAYNEGKNITELLRLQQGITHNTPEIIETAYDLQAGSYIHHIRNNLESAQLYAHELATILSSYISEKNTLLDIGTGEITTLSLIIQHLTEKPKQTYAFDISWSRIYKGLGFAKEYMAEYFSQLVPFVADITCIPIMDKSINITTSSHALEPNGSQLHALLKELFRVTRDKLVLFEPCYEINSEEGKARMDRLGYIKNMEQTIQELGGTLEEKIAIKHIANPLNPTACFIISPPKHVYTQQHLTQFFAMPATNYPLEKQDGFYFSAAHGLCFPILKDIPILKPSNAILASALS